MAEEVVEVLAQIVEGVKLEARDEQVTHGSLINAVSWGAIVSTLGLFTSGMLV